MRSSNELSSSSPDDPPNVNMPPFFFNGDGLSCVAEREGLGSIDSLGCDLKEDEMCDGENPRTMLVDLINSGRLGRMPEDETLVSDALTCAVSLSLPSGAVVEQDSVDSWGYGVGRTEK